MPEASRPNMVVILGDQQHVETLACSGSSQPTRTPHIDRIAAAGARFTSAFCCSAICSPSRAAFFTGLLPHRFGAVQNGLTLPPGTPNLAGLLRGARYRLGYAGKWHVDEATVPTGRGFLGKDFPGYGYPKWLFFPEQRDKRLPREHNLYYEYLVDRGFEIPTLSDVQHPYEKEKAAMCIHGRQSGPVEASIPYFVGDESVRLIETMTRRGHNDKRPFFLWANFWGPHNPCYLPEPYFSMIDPANVPQPPSAGASFAGKPRIQERVSHYWGMHGAPWSFWQDHLARYLAYCAIIDDQVGRVVAALEAAGELDNTILIFAADHGDMMGRHQLLDKGPFMYDDIYRIPLVARGPGIARAVCDEFVYLHDLFPTLLEAAGAETPECDAQSLLPILREGSGSTGRDEVFGEFDRQLYDFPQRMVRTRRHKFIFNAAAEGELYDLEKDRHELTNVVDDPAYAAVKDDLKERLLAHLRATRDPLAGKLGAVAWSV